MTPLVRVRWSNGSITESDTWEGLLEEVAQIPWNRGRDIRNELVRRAYVWSGWVINPTLPAETLWRELQDAGLVRIELPGG